MLTFLSSFESMFMGVKSARFREVGGLVPVFARCSDRTQRRGAVCPRKHWVKWTCPRESRNSGNASGSFLSDDRSVTRPQSYSQRSTHLRISAKLPTASSRLWARSHAVPALHGPGFEDSISNNQCCVYCCLTIFL